MPCERVHAQGNKCHHHIQQKIYYEKKPLDVKKRFAVGQCS